MKFTVFYVLFILSYRIGYAQNNTIDSLKKVLLTQKEDTNKVNTLNMLSRVYSGIRDHANAKFYANEDLSLAKKIGFKTGEGNAHYRFGYIFFDERNYSKSTDELSIALTIYSNSEDKRNMARAYFAISEVCVYYGNYSKAIENAYQSLRLQEQFGKKSDRAWELLHLSQIYFAQENYSDEEKKCSEALKLYEELKDTGGMAQCYSGFGIVYFHQDKYDVALRWAQSALKIFRNEKDMWAVANELGNLGNIYEREGQREQDSGHDTAASLKFSDAMAAYKEGLKKFEEIDQKESVAELQVYLGNLHTKVQELSKARNYFDSALILAKAINDKSEIKNCYYGLSRLDSLEGNSAKAYQYYRMFINYRDSLFNEESVLKSAQTKSDYEFGKQDAITQKEIEKQKLIRNGSFAVLSIVLVFAIVFLFQRNRISKEKNRSEGLLLNILPAEVAEELKEKGTAAAKLFDDVTVLFTDFKGFTTVSEKLTPQQLVDELHACFSAFDAIISKYNIEKIKTVGDAYLAVSGLPLANPNHAEDMVKAAIEIRDFMLNRKSEIRNQKSETFEVRIGIHSGSVVAGIVGVKKFAYDIWGDTVNTAARMEQNGEAGKVNISEATYELVKNKFNCEYRGEIDAKNKGKLKMYFVV